MTLLRNNNNISMDFGFITKINGDIVPVQALVADIVYEVEVIGLDGPNVILQNVAPGNRVTNDVEVTSMDLETLCMVVTRYLEPNRTPETKVWAMGSEGIIFDDCEKKPGETTDNIIVAFLKKLVGRN